MEFLFHSFRSHPMFYIYKDDNHEEHKFIPIAFTKDIFVSSTILLVFFLLGLIFSTFTSFVIFIILAIILYAIIKSMHRYYNTSKNIFIAESLFMLFVFGYMLSGLFDFFTSFKIILFCFLLCFPIYMILLTKETNVMSLST